MTINEIQNLIRFVAKSGVSEIELEMKDFTIRIKNSFSGQEYKIAETPIITGETYAIPAIQPSPIAFQTETIPSLKESATHPDESKYVTVKSPMIGTFYLTPGTDKPPFVKVGDQVKQGQTLCIIEAMKLFNEIESEVSGEIIKILIEDASPVEYDQPLFLVKHI